MLFKNIAHVGSFGHYPVQITFTCILLSSFFPLITAVQLALKQILMIFAIGRYEARILMERVEAEDMSRRTEHEVCHLIVILLSSKEKHAMQS